MAKANKKNTAPLGSISNGARSGISLGTLFRSPAMGAFVGMVIVFIIFAMFGFSRNFLSIGGIANWMNFASTVGIVARECPIFCV